MTQARSLQSDSNSFRSISLFLCFVRFHWRRYEIWHQTNPTKQQPILKKRFVSSHFSRLFFSLDAAMRRRLIYYAIFLPPLLLLLVLGETYPSDSSFVTPINWDLYHSRWFFEISIEYLSLFVKLLGIFLVSSVLVLLLQVLLNRPIEKLLHLFQLQVMQLRIVTGPIGWSYTQMLM